MSEDNITTSDTPNENEIEINLAPVGESLRADESITDETPTNETTTTESRPKRVTKAFKSVEPKNVGELTDDERAIIIANAKNGVDQPNFDVRFFRNGKFRIVRKKEKPPTVAEKVVKTQEIPQNIKKAYYTDNQLLFEHIIELNAKVDRLMTKHKKLKRKYQTLQNDIYIDDDEIETIKPSSNEPTSNEPTSNEPTSNEPTSIPTIQSTQQMQLQSTTRQNWRSRLRYLSIMPFDDVLFLSLHSTLII